MKRRLLLVLLILGLMIAGYLLAESRVEARDKAFGIILETRGQVTLVEGNNARKAFELMPLESGVTIKTGRDGSLSYVKYSNGREYRVGPNSVISITGINAVVESGEKTPVFKKSKLPLPKNLVLNSRKVMGEVGYLHELFFNFPRENEVLAVTDFTIEWAGKNSETADLVIMEKDATGETPCFTVMVPNQKGKKQYRYANDTSKAFHLKPGKEYVITLSSIIDGNSLSVSNNFRIISEKELKELESTRRTFEKALEENPDYARLYLLMADYYRQRQLYRDSIKMVKKYLDKKPDNPYAYYYLGELYDDLDQGNSSSQVRESYQKGSELEAGTK
ncbi:MAG: tetratricopeptide repeat protein [Vulcanimicrobiota bacterium]